MATGGEELEVEAIQLEWLAKFSGAQPPTKVTSDIQHSPVDRSDTDIDIDTSFSDMVEEGLSTRPPHEKGGFKALLPLPCGLG